jgi:ribosomal protein L24
MVEGTLTIKNTVSVEKINAQSISVKTRNLFDTGGTLEIKKQSLVQSCKVIIIKLSTF